MDEPNVFHKTKFCVISAKKDTRILNLKKDQSVQQQAKSIHLTVS